LSTKCLKCGEPLEPQMQKCPKCGSGDRYITVEDSFKAVEMVNIKEKAEGSRKFRKHSRYGEKIGKNGKIVRETRTIDRKTGEYYHRIEAKNGKGEWVTIHEEREPLEQHRPKDRRQKS